MMDFFVFEMVFAIVMGVFVAPVLGFISWLLR